MPRAARWYATSEDEQAVLVGTQGPTRPRVYETRPDMNASPLPAAQQRSSLSAGSH